MKPRTWDSLQAWLVDASAAAMRDAGDTSLPSKYRDIAAAVSWAYLNVFKVWFPDHTDHEDTITLSRIVTDDEIFALKKKARSPQAIAVCRRALQGDRIARAECAAAVIWSQMTPAQRRAAERGKS